MADYIAMLYYERNQDSIFFIGTDTHKDLLKHLEPLVPDMFRSDCPIFMPSEYSRTVELRLDNNIIMYEKQKDKSFHLIDKFAVLGGSAPIALELGLWDESSGVQLQNQVNRWDRRNDLMGAKFINTHWANGKLASFIYNSKGNIIGSKGLFQDQLFYITNSLNVTVETRNETLVSCAKLLRQQAATKEHLTDVCSGGLAKVAGSNFNEYRLPITMQDSYTLFARVPTERNMDMWAYLAIFDLPQWSVFVSALIIISFMIPFSHNLLRQNQNRMPVSEGFAITYMFVLQQGSHRESRHMSARILSLTLSMLTMLVWMYYSNDITSHMTAGPAPHPVKNFDDAQEKGFKVIIAEHLGLELLKNSKTAENYFYKRYYKEEYEQAVELLHIIDLENNEEKIKELEKKMPSWYLRERENNARILKGAVEQILHDKETLLYISRRFADEEHILDRGIIDLEIEDSLLYDAGLCLSSFSEYVPVFRHYILKAFETGIYNRIHLTWTPIKIGLDESSPIELHNVMSLNYFLAGISIMSLITAVVEKLVHMCKSAKSRKNEVTFISLLALALVPV